MGDEYDYWSDFSYPDWLMDPADTGGYWDPSWDQYFEDVDFNDPNAPEMGDWFGDQTSWWDNMFPPSSVTGGILGSLFGGGGSSDGTSLLGGIPWGALLGIGAGAALGSMNGAEQAGVTTSTSAPWGPQQPYLLDLFNRSQAALGSAGQPSAAEQSILNQIFGLGNLGERQVADTMSGVYMNPDNPMYKSIMDDALNQWNNAYIPGMTSGAYSKDMTGPLSANSAFGQNVYQGERAFGKNMANQLASNLFNPERQRQVAYAGMFNPGTSYGLAQGQRMDPFNVLQQYGRNVTGSYGGTQTQPYYTNQPAGILGGALAGSQIWNNLFKA